MKKLILLVVVTLIGAISANAQNTEYREEVKKLVKITSPAENISDMLYATFSNSHPKLSEEELRTMSQDLTEVIYPDMVEALIAAYYEVFTLDEVKQLIKFYKTPIGKKLSANMSKITEVTSKELMKPETQAKMMPIIMKYIRP